MKFELIREVKWDLNKESMTDYYWIKVDNLTVDLVIDDRERATKRYHNVKANYLTPFKEILIEETYETI